MSEEERRIIENGHPPMADKVLMIDFDGTLFPFGHMFDYPAPLPGAVETMQMLCEQGYTLGIFTSRLNPTWLEDIGHTYWQHFQYIKECLEEHNIPYHFITGEKRPAEAYIDDKAITFTTWEDIRRRYEDR